MWTGKYSTEIKTLFIKNKDNFLIKNKAIQKLNKITDGKNIEKYNKESSSSSYEEMSEEGEEETEPEFISEGESKNETTIKESKEMKGSLLTSKSMISNKEDYYHVNLTKITFCIYNMIYISIIFFFKFVYCFD